MEREYRFEVYTEYFDDEKEYVVRYIDFEHVIGSGSTLDEAIKEAKDNLDFYLDYCKDNNIRIPSPSRYEEYDYSGKVTLRMSKGLHMRADRKAKEEGVSLNAYLNEAVAAYLEYEKDFNKNK